MARKTKRATLVLTAEQRTLLLALAGSRTAPIREVERAKILLGYADGGSISDLMRAIGVGRPMIYKCIDKALAAGGGAGLKDIVMFPSTPKAPFMMGVRIRSTRSASMRSLVCRHLG